jgi:hypothetical protein
VVYGMMKMGQGLSFWKELLGIPEIKIVGKNGKPRVVANTAAIRKARINSLVRCIGHRMISEIAKPKSLKSNSVRCIRPSDLRHQPKVPR